MVSLGTGHRNQISFCAILTLTITLTIEHFQNPPSPLPLIPRGTIHIQTNITTTYPKKPLTFLCLVMGAPLAFDPLSHPSQIPSYWTLFYDKTDESKGYSSDLLYLDYTWKTKDAKIPFSPNPYIYHPKKKSSFNEGRNYLVEKGLELEKKKGIRYDYVAQFDEDVLFDFEDFERFLDVLRVWEPAVLVPYYPIGGEIEMTPKHCVKYFAKGAFPKALQRKTERHSFDPARYLHDFLTECAKGY